MYREQTYRELLVADQRQRAAVTRINVIRTYTAISVACFSTYLFLTFYYSKYLSRTFTVPIDGVPVTVFEDYLSTISADHHVGPTSYFFATFLWRFIPSAALLIGVCASVFAAYVYLNPEDKKFVTYFTPKDVKQIHDRSIHLNDPTGFGGTESRIYDEAELAKLSEARFKTKASDSGASAVTGGLSSTPASPTIATKGISKPGNRTSLFDSVFAWRSSNGITNPATNDTTSTQTQFNRSTISTQEELNRYMEAIDRTTGPNHKNIADDNANIFGASATNNEALLAILGTNVSGSPNRYSLGSGMTSSSLFGDFNQQQQRQQGIEVMFGFSKNAVDASGRRGDGPHDGTNSSTINSSNVAALFGKDSLTAFGAAASSSSLAGAAFGSGGNVTTTNPQNRTGGPQLSAKQLRMLQMWHSLNITDITVSTASARRWVCGILNDLVKDINRCNRELAARNMNDLDCSHSLLMMHTAPTTTTAAPTTATTTTGFGTTTATATATGTATGFGGATGGFGTGTTTGFGAKPAGGFGAATTTTGFGAPTAGIVPANVPLTKGQQLMNDKAVLNSKPPTADSMDLLELINMRLALEMVLDVANSLLYRAVRSIDNVPTTTAPTTAAPAAGGFGTGGGFGATTGGFGAPKPATTGGFGTTGTTGFGAPPATTGTGLGTAAAATPKQDNSKKINSAQERQLHRPYILHRISALAAQRGLQAFDNEGGDISGWNESLPTDSHLILHILQMRCPNVFADAVKLAHAPVASSEVQTAFRPSGAKSASPTATRRGVHPFIHVGSVGEPYFFVESSLASGGGLANAHLFSHHNGPSSSSKFYLTMQTSDSLFEAIVLFSALMKKAKPNDAHLQELGLYALVI